MLPSRPACLTLAFVLSSFSGAISAQNETNQLPVVDLEYEIYRASSYNSDAGYYNFSNIRYAAPPVDNLRFRAPTHPATNRSAIQDGNIDRICPQASPAWNAIAYDFFPEYLSTGNIPNVSLTEYNASSAGSATRDPRETEDCLFLDVLVPERALESAKEGKRAPVIVWIFGGGYVVGSKTVWGDPSGLIQRSITNESDGLVYVAINYRLGAFGFLSGPSFQEDGTANAGLLDQRFALEWIQDNIHLFGGDKNRVTVMGESAGGGSIMHQLTAFGGGKAPFQQAIPQSPGWYPYPSLSTQEDIFETFLEAANVSSLQEARNLPSDQLILANAAQVAASTYGQYTFGPTVDGNFITQDPKLLIKHGQFDASVRLLIGHNANEGIMFTPPITTDDELSTFVRASFKNAPQASIDHIVDTLYPPVFNRSLYRNNVDRAALIVSDAIFVCNARALRTASRGAEDAYGYFFDIAPGYHGQDVAYTFYVPGEEDSTGSTLPGVGFNETVALALQDYIVSFATTGVARSTVDGLFDLGEYARDANVVRLSDAGIREIVDPASIERCGWWSLGLLS